MADGLKEIGEGGGDRSIDDWMGRTLIRDSELALPGWDEHFIKLLAPSSWRLFLRGGHTFSL